MKRPMMFGDPHEDRYERCDPDCAWIVKNGRLSCCAVALIACENMAGRAWMPANKRVDEEEPCR